MRQQNNYTYAPYHVLIALKDYGVTEIAGDEHNDRILEYNRVAGFSFVDDETAWCSIYLNYVAKMSGLPRSGSALARSWLNVGMPVDNPLLGDVVVFSRGNSSWQGHVGLFINYSEDKKYIYVLGGNQNNGVNIMAYRSDRLLGFRRLT